MSTYREQVFAELSECLSKFMVPEKKYAIAEVCKRFFKDNRQNIDDFLKKRNVRDFRSLTDIFRECKNTDVVYQENGRYYVKYSNPEYISPEEREALRRGTLAGYRRDLADGVTRSVQQIGLNLAKSIFREFFTVDYYPNRKIQSAHPITGDISSFLGIPLTILIKNLDSVGITKMTPLQMVALPHFREHYYLDYYIHSHQQRGASILLCLGAALACLKRTGACLVLIVTESDSKAAEIYNVMSLLFDGLPFTCYLSKNGDGDIVMDTIYIADVARFKIDMAKQRIAVENVVMFATKDVEPQHFRDRVFVTYSGFQAHYRIFCTKIDDAESREAFIKFCGPNTEFAKISQYYF